MQRLAVSFRVDSTELATQYTVGFGIQEFRKQKTHPDPPKVFDGGPFARLRMISSRLADRNGGLLVGFPERVIVRFFIFAMIMTLSRP